MTQKLLTDTGGRLIPVAELLLIGYGGRQHIRKNALQHLHQEIAITRQQGSFSMEECLAGLARAGSLSDDDARRYAHHTDEMDLLLRR